MSEHVSNNPKVLLRLQSILAPNGPIPVSKSHWWRGVADGSFPQPVHLGPRITCWRAEDIEALVAKGVRADGANK